MPPFFSMYTTGNRIFVQGPLRTRDMRRVLAAIHNLVSNLGYQDLELDFSACSATFGGPMLALAAYSERYLLNDNINIDLTLPNDSALQRLFLNANWAHLINPQKYEPTHFKGRTQIPAMKYGSGPEQHAAMQNVMEKIVAGVNDFDRSHLKALEWSLNEITDNVINHAQSVVGGFLQVTNFGYKRRAVEFAVCDAGIGIPTSLREGHREIGSDQDALDKAIREGVTRDRGVGQGNGLYGSWRVTQISEGSFEIHSGNASLISYPGNLRVSRELIPFNGTLVVAVINYDRPLALEEALSFRGKPHIPVDIVELTYEANEEGLPVFPLAKEAQGFGSRAAGLPVRQKLRNLLRLCDGKRLIVDFGDVPIVSSSFADEAFAKLFVEMGPVSFMRAVEFRNVDSTIQGLIDRAIEQRTRTGL